jgi:hypothetical protein
MRPISSIEVIGGLGKKMVLRGLNLDIHAIYRPNATILPASEIISQRVEAQPVAPKYR